ncbi:unnamed protein product [Amoebophrya sp. A120]|nr:unnamed protein product [Amoebophrya sp. A120]|eukprot:GSA120T00009997001.1
MASSAAVPASSGGPPSAKVRIRNFAGHEEVLSVNPDSCTTIGDLVEAFYAQDLAAKFLKVGQLYPPKHRLKWLKWEEEASEEEKSAEEGAEKDDAAGAGDGFLPTSAKLDFRAGTAYQFVIVAARDWQANLEKLKRPPRQEPKADTASAVATGDEDEDDPSWMTDFYNGYWKRIDDFFGSMSLSDGEDFIYDRAYLIPPSPADMWTNRADWKPWRRVVETLAANLPHRQYVRNDKSGEGEPGRNPDYLSPYRRSLFWPLVRAVLMLPVREWKKHGEKTQFFALPEREQYAQAAVAAFLFDSKFCGSARWGDAEDAAFAIALDTAEMSAGAAAKVVAKQFASGQEIYTYDPDRSLRQRYGWDKKPPLVMTDFLKQINRGRATKRCSSYRHPMRLLLRNLHTRGKLEQFQASLCRLCDLAGLKLEWMSETVPYFMKHNDKSAWETYKQEEKERHTMHGIEHDAHFIATSVGGMAVAALEMWSLLVSEIRECFPTAELSFDFTTTMKDLEDHVAAANADIVSVMENLGIAKQIDDALAAVDLSYTWERNFAPGLRNTFVDNKFSDSDLPAEVR